MFRPRSKSAAPLGTIQKFRRRIALTTLTALALFSLLIGAESAAAAVNATKAAINIQPVCSPAVTVTNGNDSGPGSLRQAIFDACEDATITFADNMTVQLSFGELSIDKSLTIDGTGYKVTLSVGAVQVNAPGLQAIGIDTNDLQQALSIFFVAPGSVFNLQNVTVSDGDMEVGGGIFTAEGSLSTVSGCTFTGNSAAVGGAIFNSGTMSLTNCTFAGNSAFNGGGAIYNSGTMSLTNCTFAGNVTGSDGGVIYNEYGTLTVNNSIVSGSTGSNCSGTLAGSSNLADDGTCGDGFADSAMILIGSLSDNGGWTHTFPLLPGSAALDAADGSTCPATDQRGIERPQGSACDIGAFELVVIPPDPPDNDTCSLQVYPPVFSKVMSCPVQDQVRANLRDGVCDRPDDCGYPGNNALGADEVIALLRLLSLTVPLQPCMIVSQEDTVFAPGATPVWSSESIQTVVQLRLTRRVMLALVFINPFTAQAGTYTVTVGQCSGTVGLKNL